MDADKAYIGTSKSTVGDSSLEIFVDRSPIYPGSPGAVVITFSQREKRFSDSALYELVHLAYEINIALRVFEHAKISDVLLYGEDSKDGFKLSIIPYSSCDLFAKMTGLYYAVFGALTLSDKQVETIAAFHKKAREEVTKETISNEPSQNTAQKIPDTHSDAFCRDDVITNQKIKSYKPSHGNTKIDLLYDSAPKGVYNEDDHLLIVPQKNEGHCDGSAVSSQKRVDLLDVARKVTKNFNESEKILLIERIGDLQGVKHKHLNVISLKKVPRTFYEKICTIFNQIFPAKLKPEELKQRIAKWQALLA